MTRWDRDVPGRWGPPVAKRWGSGRRGRLPATLLVVGDTCWSCRAPVRAIVGVLVDPGLTEHRSGPQCDALIGRFRVDDLLSEHRMAGGTLADLTVDVTVDLLDDHMWRGAPRMR